MIFLVVISGKMIFLFPENMILFFRRKMKDDLSQKKYMEIYIYIYKCYKYNITLLQKEIKDDILPKKYA